MQVAPESLFYEDPVSHAWREIDNRLQPTTKPGFMHVNKANRFSSFFAPSAGTGTMLRFEIADTAVEFRPIDALLGPGQLTKQDSITYKSVYPHVDVNYTVKSDELREQTILNNAKAPRTFEFEVHLENLTPIPNDDGSVGLVRPGETMPVLRMPRPFISIPPSASAIWAR